MHSSSIHDGERNRKKQETNGRPKSNLNPDIPRILCVFFRSHIWLHRHGLLYAQWRTRYGATEASAAKFQRQIEQQLAARDAPYHLGMNNVLYIAPQEEAADEAAYAAA